MSKKYFKRIMLFFSILFLLYQEIPMHIHILDPLYLSYLEDFRFSMAKPEFFYYWECLQKGCRYHSGKHNTYYSAGSSAVHHSEKYHHPIKVFSKKVPR